MRSTVDLPAPEGPRTAVMAPRGASKDTSATAGVPADVNRLVTACRTMLIPVATSAQRTSW